ncbi:MAG TPA: DUF5681 domain-containing protein [Rhizomicrobium sp.]|nr:DUF5681 domain-containing protein [Rhizomicrobium sp.]
MPARAKKSNESKAQASDTIPAASDPPASDYEARYRQPPKAYRFKPGQSGNPSGRPKATKRLLSELEAALSAPVTIRIGSRKRRVSKMQAAVKSLADRAASGDPRILRLLLAELRHAESRAAEEPAVQEDLTDVDRDVIAAMLQRIGRTA